MRRQSVTEQVQCGGVIYMMRYELSAPQWHRVESFLPGRPANARPTCIFLLEESSFLQRSGARQTAAHWVSSDRAKARVGALLHSRPKGLPATDPTPPKTRTTPVRGSSLLRILSPFRASQLPQTAIETLSGD